MNPPKLQDVDTILCAKGGPFEMETVVLHGREGRIWKHVRDPHVSEH